MEQEREGCQRDVGMESLLHGKVFEVMNNPFEGLLTVASDLDE